MNNEIMIMKINNENNEIIIMVMKYENNNNDNEINE